MPKDVIIETSLVVSFQSGHFLLIGPSGPPVLVSPDSDCWHALQSQKNAVPVLRAPCCICKCGEIHGNGTHRTPKCE